MSERGAQRGGVGVALERGRGKAVRQAPVRVGRWVRARFHVVAAVIVLLFVAIGWQAYALQIDGAEHFRALAERQHVTSVEVAAPRGGIFDARGRELAATADIDSVYANPREVVDVAGTAERLAEALGLDVREVEARLASRRHFVWLERHVTDEESSRIRKLALPGVGLTAEPRRFYPGKTLAGPVLGFAGIDGRGLAGLELTMDRALTGQRSSVRALRDASGELALSEETLAPRPGSSVHLTIDRAVQFTAERALAEAVEAHKARAGVAIVLDVKTGAVLAMASVPSLDPNSPGRIDPQARNRAVTDVAEIGSVMKVFTVAAALDAGAVTPATQIDCERGRLQVGRKLVQDTHEDGVLDIAGVLRRSSNVGAVKIARKLGRDGLYDALVRFGFGQKSGIELPGEENGLLRPPARWGEIGFATVAFGYGLSVTPIQVAAALAAIGNGGVYHAPHLIAEVRGADGAVRAHHDDPGRRIMSEATARALLPMLAGVFERGKDGGTAGNLIVEGFRAGGKTGTAHKIDPATGSYGAKLYLASFAGLAPIDDPRVAVVVMIDEPSNGQHFGAQVAGPAWARIVSETLRQLGVAADPDAPVAPAAKAAAVDRAPAEDSAEPVGPTAELDVDAEADALAGLPIDQVTALPDFRGLGLAAALARARAGGIRVEVRGSGRVVEQEPAPGLVRKPAECRLVLAEPGAAPRPAAEP